MGVRVGIFLLVASILSRGGPREEGEVSYFIFEVGCFVFLLKNRVQVMGDLIRSWHVICGTFGDPPCLAKM